MKKVELINKHKLDIKKNLREAKKVQKEFEKFQCLFYQKKESLADEVEKLKKEVNFVVHFFFFFFQLSCSFLFSSNVTCTIVARKVNMMMTVNDLIKFFQSEQKSAG